jgi:hypothetical protein
MKTSSIQESFFVGSGLNLSKALSPPVQGRCRKHAVPAFLRKAKFPHFGPIHEFSRARTSELYGNTHNDGVRETKINRICAIDALDLFWRKGDIQRLDILLEMLDLPSADYGEHIWSLVQDVCDRN